jgi:hypothetical protein
MQPMRWREAAAAIAALFAVSRGALVLIATFLERNIPLTTHGETYSSAPLLASLTGSDSVYYLGIAAGGYHAEPNVRGLLDWAFFPLYPIVTRAASYLTFGDIAVAGVLVANLAFMAALVVLYRLSVPHLGHDVSIRSLGFVALAPGAVAFAMAYSDSLFLLLAAGAFLAAEQRRCSVMALLYGLASLTRVQGILLGLPLLVLLVQASGGWRTPRLAWLVAGPIGLGAFAAYLGARFGDPLGMFHAQAGWDALGRPGTAGASVGVMDRFEPLALFVLAVLLGYVLLAIFLPRDRVPLAYIVLAVVSAIAPLATLRFASSARFMAVTWPFAWVLARRGGAWFRLAGLPAAATLFVLFAVLNFTQTISP